MKSMMAHFVAEQSTSSGWPTAMLILMEALKVIVDPGWRWGTAANRCRLTLLVAQKRVEDVPYKCRRMNVH